MITVTMSVGIDAERKRVWRALTRPDEVVSWNTARMAAVDVGLDYPKPGDPARWRYRLHGVPMAVVENPLEVVPAERLRSELRLSLVRFDQTYTLIDDAGEGGGTRVSLKLTSPNSIPMVGGALDRFQVREMAQTLVDDTLRSLQEWCERSGRR